MAADDYEPEFDYQGYLIFNQIHDIRLLENSDLRGGYASVESELEEKLPQYNPSDTPRETQGYQNLPLRDEIRDNPKINGEIQDIASSLISYRYLEREFSNEEAYVDGERKNVDVIDETNADIYWLHPDFAVFRGAKGDAEDAKGDTSRSLSGDIQLGTIRFNPDFLLWVYYRYKNDKDLDNNLEVDRLTDADVVGDRDPFGGDNKVGDSEDLAQSVPLIAAVLMGKDMDMLQGNFSLFNESVKAEIQRNKVHVKASYGSVSSADSVRRVAIALAFMRELMDAHETWKQLPDDEKYPPFGFFRDIYQVASQHNVDINEISEEMRREYANKRGEDLEDWGIQE